MSGVWFEFDKLDQYVEIGRGKSNDLYKHINTYTILRQERKKL